MSNTQRIWPGPEDRAAGRRMQRWLDRLSHMGACAHGKRFASRYTTPEAAMLAAQASDGWDGDCVPYDSYPRWYLYNERDLRWFYRGMLENPKSADYMRRVFASPEWHSLPWQRDPEVARG